MSATLSPDQIPDMISSPQFGALPPEQRTRIAEEALAHGAQSFAGKWDQPTYQKWGQFASTVRGKVAGMESMGEKAAGVGGVVLDAGRSMARMAVAGATDLSAYDPKTTEMRVPGGNIAEQAGFGMRKIGDTLNTWASGGKEPLERDLKKLREDVDKGNLPLDNVDKLGTWLEDRSTVLGKSQEHLYNKIQGGEPWPAEYVQTNGLMNPNHAALLSRYIQTRDPQTWDALEKSLKKAPNRAKIEREQGQALENSGIVNFLSQSLGVDYAEPMVGAGDPILLAMTAFPPVRAAMAAKAVMAGTEVGAVAAAKGLAKSAGIGAGLGVAMTAENDPNATWEDYKHAAKDMLAISLGFHGAGMAVGKLGQKIQQARGGPAPTPTTAPINEPPTARPPIEQPVSAGEAPRPNPFSGPIEAPPQPVESGGFVPEPPAVATAPINYTKAQLDGILAAKVHGRPITPAEQAALDAYINDNYSDVAPPTQAQTAPRLGPGGEVGPPNRGWWERRQTPAEVPFEPAPAGLERQRVSPFELTQSGLFDVGTPEGDVRTGIRQRTPLGSELPAEMGAPMEGQPIETISEGVRQPTFDPLPTTFKDYDSIQREIDRRLDELDSQGIDSIKLWNPSQRGMEILADVPGYSRMPADLVELYARRDLIGETQLKESLAEVHGVLNDSGLRNPAERSRIMKSLGLDEASTDAAGQYLASSHFIESLKRNPVKVAEELTYALADSRKEKFDELRDVSSGTAKDAALALKALRDHYGLTETPRLSEGVRQPMSDPLPIEASVTKDSGATADNTAQNTPGAGLSPATGAVESILNVPQGDVAAMSARQALEAKAAQTAPAPVPAVLKPEVRRPEPVKQAAPIDPRVATAQKKYLQGELSKAITEAPDQHPAEAVATMASRDLAAFHDVRLRATEEANKARQNYKSQEWTTKFDDEMMADPYITDLLARYEVPEGIKGDAPSQYTPEGQHIQGGKDRIFATTHRLKELEKRMEEAHRAALPKVHIEVPGDGIFDIFNTKEALKAFEKRAAKFPTTTPRGTAVKGSGRTEPTSIPKIGKPATPGETAKALASHLSQDPTREVITYVFANGKEMIATDGRRMMIVETKAGTADKPQWFDATGKPKKVEGLKYPNYEQVFPDMKTMTAVIPKLDTGRLYTVLAQAEALSKDVERPNESVKLMLNRDRSLGIEKNEPDNGTYSHNVQDGAEFLGAFNGQFLMDMVKSARELGHEQVTLHMVDENMPAVMTAKGMRSVIMPMRGEADIRNAVPVTTKMERLGILEGKAKKGKARPESDNEALAGVPRSQAGPLPTMHGAGTGAQLPAASPAWSGQVRTLAGIRRHLLESVALPAVGVGRFQNALGIYRRTPQSVRLQAINDIPVLAHEVGHAVHYGVLSPNPGGTAEAWGGRYDAELMPLGRNTSTASYTPEQVRKEGVAEFTRLWLTNRVEAIKAAPAFSNLWETELQTRNPKMAEALRESQRRIADYIAMPEFEKAKAQISFDPAAESAGMKAGQWLRQFYAHTVNTLQPALDTVRRAAELDPTQAGKAAEAEMWMENHRGGWASKAHEDVFGHQTDLKGNRVGTGLQTILKDLKPGEHESFSAYLALKRAGELEGRGMRSGFENGKLPRAEMQALEARFEPTRQKLIKWQRNGRDLLVQSGLLDSKSAAAMDRANADYVPFYRVYEKLNGVSFGPENSKNAGGYVDLNSGIRRIKGSDRAIIDPLQSAMKNAFMFRKIAEQNHIGVQFFDLMREVQGHGQWSEQIRPKMKQTVITHDQIAQKLIDEGVIGDVADLPQNADLTLRLFEAIKKPDTKNGEVIIFKNGERQHWEVKDPLLMEALKYADADAAKLGKIPGWMLKIFTAPTRALRWGATGGPWFAIPNMIRDTVQGSVFSGSRKFVPFMDTVLGGMEVMRKGGQFERWKEAGGQFSGQVTGTQAFTRLIEDALPKDPLARRALQGLADPQAWRGGFRNALDMIGAFGRFSEQATRVGEFMRGKEAGLSDMAAANLSKTLSLNFARAGETSRVLNQFVPFFNATVQGLDQFMRMHLDPKTRGATIMKGLTYITAPSLAVWALGKDDPEIQNLPEMRKNLFWNINLKPLAAAMGMPEKGFILSIPKPFLLGAMYGTSVERALDHATGRDPNGARKAAKNILSNTLNPFDVMMSIGGIRPVIEATTGHDLFMKRDIVPTSMQHLPAEQQYSTGTSETAKMIGKFTGQSPMMIDHLLRGYFATAARFGTDAIDYGMAKMALTDVPMPATKGVMELPILNRFAGSPYAANAFVERFYKASGDMEGKLAVLNKQTDQMSTTEQQKWWQGNKAELSHYLRTVDYQTNRTGAGDIRKVQARLGEMTGAMKDIQASRVLTSDAKRDKMIELTRQRNELAEKGFKELFPAEVRKRHY